MQKQRYVGVDHHRRFSCMTVMDEKGKIVNQGTVNNCKEDISSFLTKAQCDGGSTAVLEASRNWLVMYDWLDELVHEVGLAHPLKVKAIAEAKIKIDKTDARILAHLLWSCLLPEAYVASPEAWQVRNVLRQRMFFIRLRTMVKNRVSGLLDPYPELSEQRPCRDIFSQNGKGWLKHIEVKEVDRKVLHKDLELFEALQEHIAKSNSR